VRVSDDPSQLPTQLFASRWISEHARAPRERWTGVLANAVRQLPVELCGRHGYK
jgi:hypothetical protein